MRPYARLNKGHNYILTVIDALSKYAWVVPLKSKSANEVTRALSKIMRDSKRCPKNLQTDKGKEFYNADMRNFAKKRGVNHYSTYSVMKASIVERFNRTLKNSMWKYFTLNGTYKWIDELPRLVEEYNARKHRTIKIVLGDCHGKEISLTPDTWKELLDLRPALLSHFRSDERDEARPTPIHIGQLTLRFGKLNNLRILRLETFKIRLAVSKSTVVNILNLELCINRIVASLSGLTARVDNKLTRFRDIAASARDKALIPAMIRESDNFDRNDIIDCELQALLFGES
ncbi:uncharacterized protein [Polyergus mexicanus]|uniref:uncharacterized protein n=1 Tax=Polyergus mexicanus TaxID=615972 RepID=UPI0038B68504